MTWFVSIYPYDDGNGRISRSIADFILSRDTQDEHKIYSMANVIYAKREEYYSTLAMTTNLHKHRHYDFTLWIEWNINVFISAMGKSHQNILFVIKKTKFWDIYRKVKLTKDHIQFLDTFIDNLAKNKKNEFLNNTYRNVTGVSSLTASRHIKKLLECGCVDKIEGRGKRNAIYTLLFDEDS